MREYFENQLKKIFLDTKLGREKFWEEKRKEQLKKEKNENRRTNKRSR